MKFDDVKKMALERSDTIFAAGGVFEKSFCPSQSSFISDFTMFSDYDNTMGDISLRQHYLAYSKLPLSIDNIMVTSGATAALWAAIRMSTQGERKEVIVLTPCWGTYSDIITNSGATAITVSACAANGWHHSIDCIENHISSRTAAILFANPSNPTGIIESIDWLGSLIQLAKVHGVLLIADETYYDLAYDTTSTSSITLCKEWYDVGVCIRSMSKYFLAPGLRVGFLLSSPQMIIKMHSVLLGTYLAPSTISQKHADVILNQNQSYRDHIYTCHARLHKLLNSISTNGNQAIPDAAFFVFMQIKGKSGIPVDAITLFTDTGILGRPGSSFGDSFSSYIRFNLAIDAVKFDEMCKRLERYTKPRTYA